jgi:lipoprotein-releasing system permease protein
LKSITPGSGRVAIGARLAETLGAYPGAEISLISPEGRSTPVGTVPRIVTYTVGAIFEVGIFEYDKAFVIMPMQDANIAAAGRGVGMVEVQVNDPDRSGRSSAPSGR